MLHSYFGAPGRLSLFFLLPLTFALAFTGHAAEDPFIGEWPGYNRYFEAPVAVRGNYAYIGGLMHILDVTVPSNPLRVGGNDSARARDIAFAGNYAYLAAATDGLQIYDLSNPASPVFVGALNTFGWAEGIAVAGNYAYVADFDDGFRIINISNPSNPIETGSLPDMAGVNDVAVSGNYAFVAVESIGLGIIDITDPQNPTPVAAVPAESGYSYRVVLSGNFAYLAGEDDLEAGSEIYPGLHIINIANPIAPFLAGTYSGMNSIYDLYVSGDFAYLAGEGTGGGLQVVNVSNPASPVLASQPSGVPYQDRVAVANDHVFTSDPDLGLRIFAGGPSGLTPAATFELVGFANDVAISGNYAYLADDVAGLRIIDINNPAAPVQIGQLAAAAPAQGVAVSGQYAYVACSTLGLRVVDIGNRSNPLLVATVALSNARKVATAGNLAFVADHSAGVRILDITSPSSPTIVGTYDTPGFASAVAPSGNLVYVADSTAGLQIIDVTNPGSPRLLGSFDTPGTAYDLAINGSHAYVADGSSGLQIIDITNPGTPVFVGAIDTPGTASGVAAGSAIVADLFDGVRAFDLTNPGNPVQSGSYQTLGSAESLVVAGPNIYVAVGDRGLNILDRFRLTGTIPVVTLSVANSETIERTGASALLTFTVQLSEPHTLPVSVNYDTANLTALAGTDFTGAAGTLTFAPGQISQTITITIEGDSLDEDNETFALTLSNPANATITAGSATGTIVDDDEPPAISINDAIFPEGNSGSSEAPMTVTLSAPSGKSVNVDFATQNGGAQAGADYISAMGALTFISGETTKTIIVSVNGDITHEPDETFTVALSNPVNATLAKAQGLATIINDDGPPALSISDVSLPEGNNGTSDFAFVVTLSVPSQQAVTVQYTAGNETATAPTDYAPANGMLTFPPGQTSQSIVVAVAGDTTDEENETFAVALFNPVNATIADGFAKGTIVDEDEPPALTISDAVIAEGNAGNITASFALTLAAASGKTITVGFSTADATAVAGADYAAAGSTLTFAPGETARAINVIVNGDALDEIDETFTVTLSNPVNVTIADGTASGTILDDDDPPALSIADATIEEGAGTTTVLLQVTLSAPSGRTVSVDYATANDTATAGSDYLSATGTLTFPPGETSKPLTLTINGDANDEQDERFSVLLSNPVNGTVSDSIALVTILDDDSPAPPPSLSILVTDGKIAISWPASAAGYNLEWTEDLSTPVWQEITNITTTGDTKTATLNVTGNGFLRLRKP